MDLRLSVARFDCQRVEALALGMGSMSKKSAGISTENPDFQPRRWRQQQSECRIRPSLQTSNFHQCLSLLRRQNPKPMLKKGRNVLVSTRTPRRKWCIRGGKTGLYCTLNFKHEDGLNKCSKQKQKTMNCACPWLSSTLLRSPPISPTCPKESLFTHNFFQSKKPTISLQLLFFKSTPSSLIISYSCSLELSYFHFNLTNFLFDSNFSKVTPRLSLILHEIQFIPWNSMISSWNPTHSP